MYKRQPLCLHTIFSFDYHDMFPRNTTSSAAEFLLFVSDWQNHMNQACPAVCSTAVGCTPSYTVVVCCFSAVRWRRVFTRVASLVLARPALCFRSLCPSTIKTRLFVVYSFTAHLRLVYYSSTHVHLYYSSTHLLVYLSTTHLLVYSSTHILVLYCR